MSMEALIKIVTAEGSPPIFDEVSPDPVLNNADPKNTKQRPFVVDKKVYPFRSHCYERDGVSMHYVDEGAVIPIVLTHGNYAEWCFSFCRPPQRRKWL